MKKSQYKSLGCIKTVIFYTVFVFFIGLIFSSITVNASTSEVAYARSFIAAHKEMYGEKYAPAQKLSSGEIDLSTGEVSINEIDLSLPGKGGLDLNIHRIYSSQEPSRYIRYRESDYRFSVHTENAYTYTILDGSNSKVKVSFPKEEDVVDTIYTTMNNIGSSWREDSYGIDYIPYASLSANSGSLVLERDKTCYATEIIKETSAGFTTLSKDEGNIFLTEKQEWKIAMPYMAFNTVIDESNREILFYKFGNEKGEVYDIRMQLEAAESGKIPTIPYDDIQVYGGTYTAKLVLDEANMKYTLTMTDKEGKIYTFDMGNLSVKIGGTFPVSNISDRFGNKIEYNGNEIIDSYGRRIRVSPNGIEIFNGTEYKYIVKYTTERILDQDRDPYNKLTIFTKYKLTVGRNVSGLNDATDEFEETSYITQAKETDCSLNTYQHVPVYILKEVEHPEGLKIVYGYEQSPSKETYPLGYIEPGGSVYRVSRVISRDEYTKTGTEYILKTSRTFSHSSTLKPININAVATSVDENLYINSAQYKKVNYRYDVFGRLLEKTEISGENIQKDQYLYEYDTTVIELKKLDKSYYPDYRQTPFSVTKNYINGIIQNSLNMKHTRDRKPLLRQQGLQIEAYEYSPEYRFVTETTKTVDFDRQIKTVGTVTEDKKRIARTDTFEVSGEDEILQGTTEYTYNPDGTVASETVTYNSNGDKVTTNYTYVYTLFENPQNGKHTVTSSVSTTDAAGNTRTESNTIEYDLLGNVIKETDAGGNSTAYKYDLMRRVIEETYADGTKRSIDYDTAGKTVTVTEPDGTKTAFEYDPSGNLVKTYLPDENNAVLSTNKYDELDRKVQSTVYSSPTSSITESYQYDVFDRLTKQTVDNRVMDISTDYELDNNVLKINFLYIDKSFDLNGEYTTALFIGKPTLDHDASWAATAKVFVDGVQTYHSSAHFDDVIYKTIDLRGKNTLAFSGKTVGAFEVLLFKEDILGTGTLGANTVVTATTTGDESFTPAKTKVTYDSVGKVISEEKRDNATDAVLTRDEYSYDFLGNVKEYRDSKVNLDGVGAFTTQTEYNWQGLTTKETNAVGDSKLYTYDLLGRVVEAQDETGSKTTFVYDQLGREIAIESEIIDTETARTEKYYDLSGNVIRERVKNNKAGETATYSEVYYEYDSMHRPTAIKTNDGTRDIYTQYEYDSMGNVTKVVTGQTQKVDLNGEIPRIANITQYEYDRFGNVTKTTDANGLFETAEYNFVGLPITSADKKGVTTAYTYNSYGSPLTVATAGVDTINYTYNVNNMPISVTQGTNTTTYEYDTLGRLTKETENGIVKTYQLDKVGNRTSSNVGGIETAYAYDALNRLTGVTFEGGNAGYTYDKTGRIIGETKGGINTTYTYNKAGWLTNKTNTKNNVATTYALAYSNDGNIVSRTENGELTNYTYDNLGQLVAEDDTLYEYDTRGNRTKMTKDGIVTEYRYDRTNKLMTENTNGVWTAYAYDKNGNNTLREVYEITADGTQNELDYLILSYDPLNRLTKVQKDGMTAEYTYGIDNMRLTKTVNGENQKFIWDGANIVGVTDSEGVITNRYYRGIGLISSKENDVLSYYQTNDHGDVSAWGEVTYNYDAFGNQENETVDGNPFRFCGEFFDDETGFIYLRNRYHDPTTGRFINEDPIRDGLNWYVYCENNPIMFVDPWGLADYLVVLAAGINTDSSSDYFYWMKNEIQYRMDQNGDNVRFLEVFPYGEGVNTSIVSQGASVIKDLGSDSCAGGNHVNWKITEASVRDDELIMMIGHSGGGTAVVDAYSSMDDKHKQKIVQVVTIGSPSMTIKENGDKITVIRDKDDPVPYINQHNASGAGNYFTINGNTATPQYYPINTKNWGTKIKNTAQNAKMYAEYAVNVHVMYFDGADKAANILNKFWGRSVK